MTDEPPKQAKVATTKPTKAVKKASVATTEPPAAAAACVGSSDVHILSSKACQAFAKRVDQVVAALKKVAPSATVTVDTAAKEGKNPDRGSFVITVKGNEVVACRGMPRPFTAMKALDMDAEVTKIVAAL